jgi:predicted molibdopterin-dependent oxidoreductase YjgC
MWAWEERLGEPLQVRAQFQRVAGPERRRIPCILDGQTITAYAGETILTAVLANRTTLRRFEFGTASRSGFCVMGACQDCWIALETGRRVRACSTLVEPDMRIVTAFDTASAAGAHAHD